MERDKEGEVRQDEVPGDGVHQTAPLPTGCPALPGGFPLCSLPPALGPVTQEQARVDPVSLEAVGPVYRDMIGICLLYRQIRELEHIELTVKVLDEHVFPFELVR